MNAPNEKTAKTCIAAAKKLSREVGKLDFSDAAAWVYNPLDYAWKTHRQYLEKYALGTGGPSTMSQMGRNLPDEPPLRVTEFPAFLDAHEPAQLHMEFRAEAQPGDVVFSTTDGVTQSIVREEDGAELARVQLEWR